MSNKDIQSSGWIQTVESNDTKFCCPIIDMQITQPCRLRGCLLWTSNENLLNCVGAFASAKAANSEERLQASSQREKHGTLQSAASGKLSFYDLAYAFGLSRQRIEGLVTLGKQAVGTLSPILSEEETAQRQSKRLGHPVLFTHTAPVAAQTERGLVRVCICCEQTIEPDDDEVVISIIEKAEVAWCSRECAAELPIDAYLVANRYKRHWASVALRHDEIDERSRVREITPARMEALRAHAEALRLHHATAASSDCGDTGAS